MSGPKPLPWTGPPKAAAAAAAKVVKVGQHRDHPLLGAVTVVWLNKKWATFVDRGRNATGLPDVMPITVVANWNLVSS